MADPVCPRPRCQLQRWGVNLLLGKRFAKNCMKLKEIRPGAHIPETPSPSDPPKLARTRMHSSRMRTVRSSSRLSGGGLPQCMLGYQPPNTRHPHSPRPGTPTHPPLDQAPPGADPPRPGTPPGAGTTQDQNPPPNTRSPRDQPPPPPVDRHTPVKT